MLARARTRAVPGRALALLLALLCAAALTLVDGASSSAAPSAVTAAVGSTPARAAADGTFTQVSAGGEFTCGLRADRTLWCWGRNTYGQLGNSKMGVGTPTPQQVGNHANWAQVTAGGATACGIRLSHALFCWGLDHRGQLGDGSTHAVSRPQRVAGKRNWTQVATAWFHTCGVRTDHTLWCWGDNTSGQLGVGNTKQDRRMHRVPGADWSSVSVAGWNTCAVKTTGTLWCWGRDGFGQLGIGSTADRSSPTQVGASATWVQVSLSWTHACGVLRNGNAYCWGRNDLGQVGDTAATYASRPTLVPGAHVARSIAVAEGASCLVDVSGSLWCWGDNRYGQVSSNVPATPGARVPVSRGGSYSAVTGGWFHLCAKTAAGAPTCWGSDARGQLGGSGPTAVPPAQPPSPAPARRDGPLTMRLASFNTLGDHHTQPGRDADNFAPAVLRSDWEAQMVLNQGIQVAGIEEQDAGQLAGILAGAQGKLASFPTPAAGDLGVETAVIWDTRLFKAVKTETIKLPFIARDLRRPVVELQQLSTGRQFWIMAVHNAPWSYQAKRNAEVKLEIAKLQQLETSNLPVFFVGDFNEKATVLCKVLKGTGLGSASGGHLTANGQCVPPRQMRIDWIFGSRALVDWGGFSFSKPPLARLSTDHFIPVVDVTAP